MCIFFICPLLCSTVRSLKDTHKWVKHHLISLSHTHIINLYHHTNTYCYYSYCYATLWRCEEYLSPLNIRGCCIVSNVVRRCSNFIEFNWCTWNFWSVVVDLVSFYWNGADFLPHPCCPSLSSTTQGLKPHDQDTYETIKMKKGKQWASRQKARNKFLDLIPLSS